MKLCLPWKIAGRLLSLTERLNIAGRMDRNYWIILVLSYMRWLPLKCREWYLHWTRWKLTIPKWSLMQVTDSVYLWSQEKWKQTLSCRGGSLRWWYTSDRSVSRGKQKDRGCCRWKSQNRHFGNTKGKPDPPMYANPRNISFVRNDY